DQGEAPDPGREFHQPVGLLFTDDVEGQEDVVGDIGFCENVDLAELLAGDPDGTGRDLHLPDRRDLVRLDVRPVALALAGDGRLDVPDVVLQPVEKDGYRRRLEVVTRGHRNSLEGNWDGGS